MKTTFKTLIVLMVSLALHSPLLPGEGLGVRLSAQELPQGYFRNPLDFDIGLSATFAELRLNHFHAGLDMRTGGEVDKAVHAAADGYVAKVSISPWGGGKILYIKHPNGFTTVYMHLNSYAGEIGRAILKEQYAQQRFAITKLFAPNELPVRKGQLVAYSGNTGGSGGPHLHFEVRRGGEEDLHTHATIYNPLLFGLPYRDSQKPTIRGLRLYQQGKEAVDVSKEGAVTVDGPFYLGIYATDAAEGSTARNGVDRVEVYLDGTLFFMYTSESLPVDSSRMVNALVDYPLMAATRQAYLLTRALPGAEGPWIPVRVGDGIFRLRPGTTHHIGIKVYDIMENCAERTLTVKMEQGDGRMVVDPRGEPVKYDRNFSVERITFAVSMPAYTLYADDRLRLEASERGVTVAPVVNDIPPNQSYTLQIKGSLPGVPAEKVVIAHVGSKRTTAQKTTHKGSWHEARVRDFGQFTLMADTTAPTVQAVNFGEGKPFKGNILKVKIADNLAGVETYNCYLNGGWILAEYDGKTATLAIDIRQKSRAGKNELRVEVTDGSGNSTRRSFAVTR